MLRLVIVCKAFRYRVYLNKRQAARLGQWDSALRFLWNIANEQRRMGLARPRDERIYPTAFDHGLVYVFHVALSKALSFRVGLITCALE
jgi:hypothetical protein